MSTLFRRMASYNWFFASKEISLDLLTFSKTDFRVPAPKALFTSKVILRSFAAFSTCSSFISVSSFFRVFRRRCKVIAR